MLRGFALPILVDSNMQGFSSLEKDKMKVTQGYIVSSGVCKSCITLMK